MREASLVDALTGCTTRAEGARRLEAELRRAQRSGTSVAVLMLDLDHFKSINDRFGHKTGDAALTAVGETLLTTLRASDVRSRWGGEEFLLVLPDSSMERAQRAADNLRQRIANTPVSAGDHMVSVTASIGVTLSEGGETDVQQLLTRADNGLYEAKRLGRNRISLVLSASSRHSGGRAPRPGPPEAGAPPAGPAARHDQPEDEWDGVERRDKRRRDRRSVPSPGRRAADAVRPGLSNAR
jgi:diguanylate cyclase (GGDEF)-like protein